MHLVEKCIVCNKSVGPFYSLHRACASVYRTTQTCLQTKLDSCKQANRDLASVVADLQACRPDAQFSASTFKTLLVKVWSEQAEQCVRDSVIDPVNAKKLLQLADEFAIYDEDVEKNILKRLSNLKYLDCLQKHQTIEKNLTSVADNMELSDDEQLIWRFEDTAKTQQQRYSCEKPWVGTRLVLNNVLLKSRYQQLATRTESAGELIITSLALHYVNDNKTTSTYYSDVHSVTPMKDGIRIQASTADATPDTYVTGDGRFTYALLQYARGRKA